MASSMMANKVVLRRYRSIFMKTHATTPERAILPSEYGILNDKVFRRLVNQKIILDDGKGRFYFDSLREKYLIRITSYRVVFILAAFVLLIFIYFLWKTPS